MVKRDFHLFFIFQKLFQFDPKSYLGTFLYKTATILTFPEKPQRFLYALE